MIPADAAQELQEPDEARVELEDVLLVVEHRRLKARAPGRRETAGPSPPHIARERTIVLKWLRAVGPDAGVPRARPAARGRRQGRPAGTTASRTAPADAVQPKAQTASQPPTGPAEQVHHPFERRCAARPAGRSRRSAATTSTCRPPTTVLTATIAKLSAVITSDERAVRVRHEGEGQPEQPRQQRPDQQVAAASGPEQRIGVADEPDQGLDVPGGGRDRPERRRPSSAGMCSSFFSSRLNGSRPMIPGQPKPVTKIPAAMTAIRRARRRRGGGARRGGLVGRGGHAC